MSNPTDFTPPASSDADHDLLKPAEVAAVLRVSRRNVIDMAASGEIAAVRVGGRREVRIPRAALDAYLAANVVVPTPKVA